MTVPRVELMASGNLCLVITEDVSWESFPGQAQAFVARFAGTVLYRVDSPAERLWWVLIRWRPFVLAFDDFPVGLTLESVSRFCNATVRSLHAELVASVGAEPNHGPRRHPS